MVAVGMGRSVTWVFWCFRLGVALGGVLLLGVVFCALLGTFVRGILFVVCSLRRRGCVFLGFLGLRLVSVGVCVGGILGIGILLGGHCGGIRRGLSVLILEAAIGC